MGAAGRCWSLSRLRGSGALSSFRRFIMLDFFGGAGLEGGCWAAALTGTELDRNASAGGEFGGIGRLVLAGDGV